MNKTKRASIVVLMLLLMVSLAGCEKKAIEIDRTDKVVLNYSYKNVVFDEELPQSEAEKMIEIINGKSIRSDNPSCGFSEEISITIGDYIFCVAQDGDGFLKVEDGKYIILDDEERAVLDELFSKYGGTFPCV